MCAAWPSKRGEINYYSGMIFPLFESRRAATRRPYLCGLTLASGAGSGSSSASASLAAWLRSWSKRPGISQLVCCFCFCRRRRLRVGCQLLCSQVRDAFASTLAARAVTNRRLKVRYAAAVRRALTSHFATLSFSSRVRWPRAAPTAPRRRRARKKHKVRGDRRK